MAGVGFVAVARVVAPHGTRGEVRAILLTDFPDRFTPGLKLWTREADGAASRFEVESARRHGRFVLIKLVGVDSMDQAQGLRGRVLEVSREDAMPLEPGRYYFHEIEGLDVVTTTGRRLGRVARVVRGKANDIFEVVSDSGRGGRPRVVLVPAVRDIVKSIDLDRGEMTIELIPGLE